jgi:hypothetical protein
VQNARGEMERDDPEIDALQKYDGIVLARG